MNPGDFGIPRCLPNQLHDDCWKEASSHGTSLFPDLRECVVARVAAGETCRKVAATFGVSVASLVKWSQRYRATGSPAAKRTGNTRPLLLLAQREWVLGRIAERPDITLQELVDELRATGKRGSYGALWRFLRVEGIRFKKSLRASEQDRPDVARPGSAGAGISARSIPPAWSSSTRPGSRPT